jgi:uncharacterized membrane protein YccC
VDVLVTIVVVNLVSIGLGCTIGWGLSRLVLRLLSTRALEPAVARRRDRAGIALRPAFNTAVAARDREIGRL